MIVVGLDPGTTRSTIVSYDTAGRIVMLKDCENGELVDELEGDDWSRFHPPLGYKPTLVIEQVESFGMAVGREVFETVFWAGRFAQAWHRRPFEMLPRRAVKSHLCHSNKATDANIRQAIIDRFGGKEKAIGLKATQGPLYHVKAHAWAALAVALTWSDQNPNPGAVVQRGAVTLVGDF